MRNVVILFSVILGTLGLTGCDPKIVIVKQHVYEVTEIPESLTKPITPEAPPAREDYVSASPTERTQMLTNYSLDLLGTIKDLNVQLESIKTLQDKNKALLAADTQKEAERTKQ